MKANQLKSTKFGIKILVESSFDEKDIIKSLPWEDTKRAWFPELNCWTVDASVKSIQALEIIKCEINPEIKDSIISKFKEKTEKIQDSLATNSDIEIPVPEGLSYLPYQKAGINYVLKNGNTLIGDEMGLGKTIQAIGVINSKPEIKKVYIICPDSLKYNWKNELTKWLVKKFSIQIIDSKTTEFTGDILIMNFNTVHKVSDLLPDSDLTIIDESHNIKNPKAKRTIHSIKIAQKSSLKLVLSGTPIKNRPIELFSQINLLRPDVFKNYWSYGKRYCGATNNGYGWDFSGSSNINELFEKLRSTCMIRRLKQDVLKELPPKFRQVIELPEEDFSSLLKLEKELGFEEKINDLRVKIELAKTNDDDDSYRSALLELKEAKEYSFQEMSSIRRDIALAKIPYVIQHIENSIEDGEKIVVFAHHTEVCEQINKHFSDKSVIITGSTKSEDRQKAVEEFQNNPNILVFVGSLGAAGVGITLTAASRVLMAEIDWVPATMQQAEDRVHRISQFFNVLIQYMLVQGSLESKIAKDIVSKLNIIDQALDKGKVKDIELTEEQINEIKNKAAEIYSEFETKKVTKEEISKESSKLISEQINEIHDKLKKLSMMCDGAIGIDGVGFNKIDSGIGKSLANSISLTQKQAYLGYKIIKKYHGQVGKLSFSI